jgi:hypothetical protein
VNYYCKMELQVTNVENKMIVTKDNYQYIYTVVPIEIANALETAVVVLDQYSVTDLNGENFKLYRTKEGNWYDMPGVNPSVNTLLLMSFKLAITSQEMNL